jgi:hypothetical protein
MDEYAMMILSDLPLVALIALGFLGGMGLGYIYFRSLRLTSDLIVGGRAPLMGVGLTLGRVGLLCAGFYLAVLAGGFVLVAALVGVLCAKAWLVAQSRGDST